MALRPTGGLDAAHVHRTSLKLTGLIRVAVVAAGDSECLRCRPHFEASASARTAAAGHRPASLFVRVRAYRMWPRVRARTTRDGPVPHTPAIIHRVRATITLGVS